MSGDAQVRQRRKEKRKQKRGMSVIRKYFPSKNILRTLSSKNKKITLFFAEKEKLLEEKFLH